MEKINLKRLEQGFCYTALILMAFLPFLDAVLRPLGIFIPFSRHLMVRLFLISGLFAAMITTGNKEHISIAIMQYAKNEKIKGVLNFCASLISSFIAVIVFWDSLSFIRHSFSGRTALFLIDDRVFAFILPIAFGTIALRFASNLSRRKYCPLPLLPILLGTAAALPGIVKAIWGFDSPGIFNAPMDFLYDFAYYARVPLILFLIVAALSGTPIFIAIGGIAMVLLRAGGGEPEVAPVQIFSALTGTDLIAIPLFTITGFFLSESKAGERLVKTFRSLFSWLPGGMIIATVVICAFFTSFTGASGVTILALGGILYTILQEKLGYTEKFSIGLLTSVGCIGLLFPPSLPIILVGSTTNSIMFFMGETVNYRIIDFFLGGIIPGIILIIAMIIFGVIASAKAKIPVEPFRFKEAISSLKGSILEILLPLILIGGYFSGILTLVEVSAFSVFYVFIAEVLINKDIKLNDIPKVFNKAVPIIGGILAILAMANALSYAFIDSEVPERFVSWMQSNVESRIVFLLLLNLALFILGCLMDIFSAILIALPLIIPLGLAYGIDPVHLGIIFIVNLEVGYLTPPVGLNLYLASYRFKMPFTQICRYVLPFLAIQIIVVFLVTYVPALSTFLVRLFN
ncbi:MAG: TRAP transporter large permease subunit [Treponema sp.]|nr:TRAP transporter large permease subunit [Treponema sp.]